MNYFSAIFLGVLQAVTEFLPVSSSGHLSLAQQVFHKVFDFSKVDLSFDILLHFATFLATAIYVRKDIFNIIKGILNKDRWALNVSLSVIVASIPAAVVGLLFEDFISDTFHSLAAVGFGFLLTSFVLELVQRKKLEAPTSSSINEENDNWSVPTLKQSLLIGLAQSVSIMPGVSRSGSTICMGLLTGLGSHSSIRFSFLMSLPVIFGATLLKSKELFNLSPEHQLPYLLGFISAFISGLFAIKLLVVAIKNLNLRPFSIYTFSLAIICLVVNFFN